MSSAYRKEKNMFIVIELQTTDGQTSALVNQYENRREADTKFHQILAYASQSTADVHSAVIMDETGMGIRQESYTRIVQE